MRGATAHVRFTGVDDGDLAIANPPEVLEPRRRAIVDLPWVWLEQVHGDRVMTVSSPTDAAGASADAAVTDQLDVVLAVHTADCAPVLLVADAGAVGAVHAGWRGLAAGVVQRAVDALAALAPGEVTAILGPCICARCYEFGEAELAQLVERYGSAVAGTTDRGAPALDLSAAVDAALAEVGVAPARRVGECTSCAAGRLFSHRARREAGRQAGVVWMEAA